MFGKWIEDETLRMTPDPFPHVVIDGFLRADAARRVAASFPSLDAPNWVRYDNPIEKKYAKNDGLENDEYFKAIQSEAFVDVIRRVSGMPDIRCDPLMHGAGYHYHPEGGKLDMHIDYSIHPITGAERRLNLVLYLADVKGGDLELWNADCSACVVKISPRFNRAVLFATGDASWHGMPTPLEDPAGRASVAAYYVSDPRPGATERYKAQFRPLPGQVVSEGLAKLYEIRSRRNCRSFPYEEHMMHSSSDAAAAAPGGF